MSQDDQLHYIKKITSWIAENKGRISSIGLVTFTGLGFLYVIFKIADGDALNKMLLCGAYALTAFGFIRLNNHGTLTPSLDKFVRRYGRVEVAIWLHTLSLAALFFAGMSTFLHFAKVPAPAWAFGYVAAMVVAAFKIRSRARKIITKVIALMDDITVDIISDESPIDRKQVKSLDRMLMTGIDSGTKIGIPVMIADKREELINSLEKPGELDSGMKMMMKFREEHLHFIDEAT